MSRVPLDRSAARTEMSARSRQNTDSGVAAGREPMIKVDRWECLLSGIGWPVGFAIALFLIAGTLILIPPHVLVLDSVAYVILTLFLVNWLYLLGFAAFVLIIIWLVIKAKTVCRQAAREQGT